MLLICGGVEVTVLPKGIECEGAIVEYGGVLVYWEYCGIDEVKHGVSSLYGGTANLADVHGDQLSCTTGRDHP